MKKKPIKLIAATGYKFPPTSDLLNEEKKSFVLFSEILNVSVEGSVIVHFSELPGGGYDPLWVWAPLI